MTVHDLPIFLKASGFSLLLALGAIPLATILALFLVLMERSHLLLLRWIYGVYIWIIRGTPLLLIAMLLFYTLASAGLGINPYLAGILAIGIYHSSFIAEILRGAINAISRSTLDSAKSLALPRLATYRRVIAPLTIRQALPAYINVCVMILKASSVLSVIGVWELTYAGREITERTLDVFPVLGVTASIYFVLCFSIDRFGKHLERRLAARGFAHELKELH